MRKKVKVTITIICIIFGFVGFSIKFWASPIYPEAVKGELDLTQWNFANNGSTRLDGEWEYYRNQLLTPDDFDPQGHNGKLPEMTGFVRVPDSWEKYAAGGLNGSSHGFATFRLHVNLQGTSGQIYGIRQINIKTAHKLFVNGREIGSGGIPGTNIQETLSVNTPYVRFLQIDGNHADIIIQVANFQYFQGGITHPIYLGYQEDILSMREFAVVEDLLATACFLLIGAYFIILFLMRGRERSWLYFGLCCLAVCVYLATHGEKVAAMFAPGIPFELFLKIQTFSGAASELFLLLYAMESFPGLFKKVVMKGFGLTLAVRLLLILLTPAPVFSKLGSVGLVLAFFEILYVAYVMSAGMMRRREGSSLMLIGALSLLIIEVASALDILGIVSVLSIQTAAWICFAVAQGLFLSKRFVNTFKTVETLSERLRFMDRVKDEFLANTSHEMKTPLHAIINIAGSLLEGAAGPMSPDQKMNVAMIKDTGKRMANLLGDLLDFSKLKNGELVLKRKTVALQPIARLIFEMFRYMAGDKPVKFVDLLNDRLYVYVDEDRLVQILNNLVGNALKFTDSGQIVVSARENDGWLAVSVSDTGIGIPQDKLEVIFESFEQAGKAVAMEYGGMGLGLSVTKRLVELHGGSIWVESEQGKGAVFTFTVPSANREVEKRNDPGMNLTNPLQELAAPQMISSNKVRLEGEGIYTILIADDDAANRQVLLNLLSVEKYTVIAVSSGMDAMREIEMNRRIDLAIIDLMMPGMSGYEVCRNIRRRYSLSELPVLLLTARNRPEDIVTAFDSGVNDFLGKPIEAGELKARIRTLLELKKSVNDLIHIEMAFLQAQIKPHFLFNTLNTVISVSHTDVSKAQDLLVELSLYLRSSFDFQNREQLVSIHKELELIESYLFIEKARFGEQLQVIYDVDEDIRCRIPPLIIQPIVENAIRHGVMKRPEGGVVRISVKADQDCLVVVVSDNGPGISDETKASLSKERTGTRGVGLANIEGRLRTLYGTGLKIDSESGQGTKVMIRIPNSIG
ncbi:hypothetical protein BC351_29350 [Paenibacillus ferrarius]|uniref:Circadian input-output histidine kinase CikA n=1 Tax=Paenibacillus ferrarius TaxID=1469647 RepID=A0A1V4HH51_9BACL|nr:ATP-binding protein [Paenibacillus ferrarius]OPH56001.1 hypothetical protein BC351_29350 [Paenibacillus ferrarius]